MLGHEVGHFLNLNIFNFQNEIVQFLYSKNQNIDINLLQSFVNEITADIIGYNLNNPTKFLKAFDKLDERKENFLPLKTVSISEYKCTQKIIGKTELLELIGLSENIVRQSVLIGLRTMTMQ